MVLPYLVKQKFYGGEKLLAVRSYHIFSKSLTHMYMKFMQKMSFRRTGKDRQNSNKDKSTERRKQTD